MMSHRGSRLASLLAVCALVAAAGPAERAAPPDPGPELVYAERPTSIETPPRPSNVTVTLRRIGCLASGGACQIVAGWVKPASWRPTDSLRVQWSQGTPSAIANLRRKWTRGLADTLPLTRAEGLAYDGKLVITTFRVGTSVSASTTPAGWAAPAIVVPPPDTVGSVTVLSIIVKPDSARAYATVEGEAVTDSNRVQFCAAVRLSDDSVILAEGSASICPEYFAGYAGFKLSSRAGRVLAPSLRVTIEGGEQLRERQSDGTLGPAFQVARPRVAGAYLHNGEWWLITPRPLPSSS